MRHRVRRSWRHWRDIGASAQATSWIRDGVRVPFRYNRPPPRFNQGVSFNDATPAQLKFLTAELRRFTAAGAWEKSSCAWWVSRAFFVPKPGDNQWRFIIDLRVLNTFCARKRLRMETLMGVRHLTAKGDYMFSFDLQDGFYALGIAPSDRDFFTVNIRGTLYRLCGLPMGWSLSPYYFTTFTMTFVKHLRSPTTPAAPGNVPRSRRWLRRGRWRGARILPYVDDFLLFASSEPEALELRQRVADLQDSLGLLRNPTKGLWEPVQYGQHLGVDIDTATGYFYAPVDKLQRLARQAKQLLQRAARDARWLPVRELQSLAGRAQYLFLATPAARFYLRELHDVVGSKWGGRVRMTHQLRRDLQWWTAVPTQANGRPIHRPVETAYMHCDSSGYVESFLPHLAGRRVLLHEDNQAVCSVLAGLTSRSPAMMAELRKLWYLLDSNGVHIRARYIRSAANVWADRLSRHLDSDDWQLDPVLFAELEAMWGAHSVDRFASALNAMLPRYNAAWLDPGCEAVDSLHLSDAEWRRENNYCNPPWPLLPDLVQKLRQSGAAATVVAPRWEGKVWHQALTEMAVAERVGVPPLGGTAATVARYIAWQGLRGTVKAASLQPYLSAINGFYRDHGAEPVAQGDLISKVRKGLAASQVEPDPPGVRTDVPARLITRTLRLAETLHSLQLVAHMLEEHPPPGFVWTSHSLRKGAATAAYAIGVVLQKIKHFGGWAQLSSVVLDYINPTALPGGKELTGDTHVEIEEIEEIESNGDPTITPTDGNNELEEAEVEARQRQKRLKQARDQRAEDQLDRLAADHDE
eukprot:jgi/Tetstr1/456816/TSEL_043490.t1